MWIARGMAAATIVLWAANYIWSKELLAWLDPVAAAEARFSLSAVVLLALAAPGGSLLAAFRAHWRGYLALGGIGISLYQLLRFVALDHMTAVNGAIVMALTPVLTMAGAAGFLGDAFGWRAGMGMLIAVAGALLAVLGDSPAGLAGLTLDLGEPIAFAAAICMAFYTVAARRLLPSDVPVMTNTALVIATGTLLLLPFCVLGGPPRGAPTRDAVVALVGVALGATVLGYIFWNRAVQVLGVSEPNLLYNFIPVLTMIMVALRGTSPYPAQVIGGLLVAAGVTLSVCARRPQLVEKPGPEQYVRPSLEEVDNRRAPQSADQ